MPFDLAPVPLLDPAYLASSYNLFEVAASFLIAVLASYVTLDLARRVRSTTGQMAYTWWIAGALVMGTGIWATHFVGMQAFKLPIELGYTGALTLASWVAVVVAAGVAFGIASQNHYGWRRVVWGSLCMGGGICAMHYMGMAAIALTPAIVWDPLLVGTSVVIAVLASASALMIFRLLVRVHSSRRPLFQVLASLVMGVAICGMHYTGMAAAQFPMDAVCTSAGQLGGTGLTAMVLMATGMLLVSSLFTSIIDARMQATAERLNTSLQSSNAQLQQANTELQQRAFADALTDLPNRLLFEDRLRHALLRHARSQHDHAVTRLAVLFVDLDGFKPINDSFGHAAGDEILKSTAARLLGVARECDTVARIGGDEFLLLLDGVGSSVDAMGVARRVLQALGAPFNVADKQVQIAASIGIVIYPDHGDAERLIAHADAAMYSAKRTGGGTYALFEPHMDSDASEQLELQSDLRQALDKGELSLHYQPKIDGKLGHINGVEALLRWSHPVRGMVPPAVFITLAERFGLINRLGNWVIADACRQIAAWRGEGMHMRVAINLSVHQLREAGLAERIADALAAHGVQPDQLLCEITESVAMEDITATQRTFEELKRIGVFLSIDDFGTGYSSLNYLRQLPAQQLKIDRSFIQELESQADARAVVEAVVQLAHALGLRVVAEGVETAGQRDLLLAMGCDELQGFFFAYPMPAQMLRAWAQGVHKLPAAPNSVPVA